MTGNGLSAYLDYLSTLPSNAWQIIAIRLAFSSLALWLVYLLFVQPRIEDAIINLKLRRRRKEEMRKLDANGNRIDRDTTTATQANDNKERGLKMAHPHAPQVLHHIPTLSEIPSIPANTSGHTFRDKHNLYIGTGHSLYPVYLSKERRFERTVAVVLAILLAAFALYFGSCPAQAQEIDTEIEVGAQIVPPARSEAVVAGLVIATEPPAFLIEFPNGFREVVAVTLAVEKETGGAFHIRVFCLPEIAERCRGLNPGAFVTLNGYLASNQVVAATPTVQESETHPLIMLAEKVRRPRRR